MKKYGKERKKEENYWWRMVVIGREKHGDYCLFLENFGLPEIEISLSLSQALHLCRTNSGRHFLYFWGQSVNFYKLKWSLKFKKWGMSPITYIHLWNGLLSCYTCHDVSDLEFNGPMRLSFTYIYSVPYNWLYSKLIRSILFFKFLLKNLRKINLLF